MKYKALYSKMMDDLKDGEMFLEWGKELMNESPEIGKYLISQAEYRILSSFPETKKMFDEICEKDEETSGKCISNMVEDYLCEWHDSLERKVKKI